MKRGRIVWPWQGARPDQVAAHDQAVRDLKEYGRQQRKAGNREATGRQEWLARRVGELSRPLSAVQRSRPATRHRIGRSR